MYNHKLYLIENKTSLHAGNGDANFDLIDKQIQRDVLTDYPTIHSSSLKGALKEFAEFKHQGEESTNFIDHIFGSEELSGKVRFMDAHLLSVPMRSDTQPYYNCISPKAIEQLLEYVDIFSLPLEEKASLKKMASYEDEKILVKEGAPVIEDEKAGASEEYNFSVLENLIGENVALVPHKLFKKMLKDLPVIARNSLENGESKNLWYEEVLPRKSKFYTLISEPTYLNTEDSKKLKNAFSRFHEYLIGSDTIHIGANASIGYGVCTFREFPNE